ncbi:MAG TPA: hypothetical protein QGG47_09700 [Acidobacteriota bacterium]|nr:hypothetical protein [Acidobacteriota bacterium]
MRFLLNGRSRGEYGGGVLEPGPKVVKRDPALGRTVGASRMGPRLAVYYSPLVLGHDTGRGTFEAAPSSLLAVSELHPENSVRVQNMVSVLQQGAIAERLDWHEASPAELDQLVRFHESGYLETLVAMDNETYRVTPTTVFGKGSWIAVRAAAGQAIAAVDHVWTAPGTLAYALVRPPGHHAQPAMADGYCFANNIGVAIKAAQAKGLCRVAVIDWDVHHGNGTQEGFYTDPDVLTVSLHMDHGSWGATHPQTGATDEAGRGAGLGANLNVPLPLGSGDAAYGAAFDRLVVPTVEEFAPELLIVACGQDASQFDPNGRQGVTMSGFYGLGARARALADRCCQGRMALVQEGGYARTYAALCLHTTLQGVLGDEASLADPIAYLPERTEHLETTLASIETSWRRACDATR